MSDDNHLSPDAADLGAAGPQDAGAHVRRPARAWAGNRSAGHAHRRRTERRHRLLAAGAGHGRRRDRRLLVRAARAAADARRPPPLALQVASGAIDAAGAIVARERRQQPALRFGDGTVIQLATGDARAPRGRSTATARTSRSSSGTAHVNVVHKPHARWLIDAGPYQITVHGTVFTASWDESQQRLDVQHGARARLRFGTDDQRTDRGARRARR